MGGVDVLGFDLFLTYWYWHCTCDPLVDFAFWSLLVGDFMECLVLALSVFFSLLS